MAAAAAAASPSPADVRASLRHDPFIAGAFTAAEGGEMAVRSG